MCFLRRRMTEGGTAVGGGDPTTPGGPRRHAYGAGRVDLAGDATES